MPQAIPLEKGYGLWYKQISIPLTLYKQISIPLTLGLGCFVHVKKQDSLEVSFICLNL